MNTFFQFVGFMKYVFFHTSSSFAFHRAIFPSFGFCFSTNSPTLDWYLFVTLVWFRVRPFFPPNMMSIPQIRTNTSMRRLFQSFKRSRQQLEMFSSWFFPFYYFFEIKFKPSAIGHQKPNRKNMIFCSLERKLAGFERTIQPIQSDLGGLLLLLLLLLIFGLPLQL